MQDMNPTICSNAKEGTTGQLTDLRDGKQYWVTKLADGNCWMTQNLDLDIPKEGLKATDTDITTDWVPKEGEATIATGNLNATTWPNDNALIRSYDPGEYVYTGGTTVNNCGENQTSLADCPGWENIAGKTASDDPTSSPAVTSTTYNGHYAIGNYYNYNAATAGTGLDISTNNQDAPGSICPKGWQLPYSGRDNFVGSGDGALDLNNNIPIKRNKSFVNLLEAYGWGNWNQRDQWGNPYENSVTGTKDGVTTNIAGNPLYFLRGGNTNGKILDLAGIAGFYLSSTVSLAASAYHFNFTTASVSISRFAARYVGRSIRCIAR